MLLFNFFVIPENSNQSLKMVPSEMEVATPEAISGKLSSGFVQQRHLYPGQPQEKNQDQLLSHYMAESTS